MSEKINEALLNFSDALENATLVLKQAIGAKQEPNQALWDPSKIKWEEATGNAGPYERSEDTDNLDFKALVKDLAEHEGKLSHDGMFYWLFQNGTTVGRKKRKY